MSLFCNYIRLDFKEILGKIIKFYFKNHWKLGKCIINSLQLELFTITQFLIKHVINIHEWLVKHSLCILGDHFWPNAVDFWHDKNLWVCYQQIVVFYITNNPCLPQRVISGLQYPESLSQMLHNEPCLHFHLWGVTEILCVKIMILLKNHKTLEKMFNHFLFSPVSILVNLLMVNSSK
jgi:hypothetical protein